MAYPRRRFGAFSLEVPPGLFPDDEAPAEYAAALTALVPATLRIRTIPLAGAADIAEVLSRAGGGPPRRVLAAGAEHVWPGLSATMDGAPHEVVYAFESEGQVWLGTLSVPGDLWNDYAPFLVGAMVSLDIGKRPAPTVPLFAGSAVPVISERTFLPDPVETMQQRLAEMAGGPCASYWICALTKLKRRCARSIATSMAPMRWPMRIRRLCAATLRIRPFSAAQSSGQGTLFPSRILPLRQRLIAAPPKRVWQSS